MTNLTTEKTSEMEISIYCCGILKFDMSYYKHVNLSDRSHQNDGPHGSVKWTIRGRNSGAATKLWLMVRELLHHKRGIDLTT
jgi:hypothetical protein